MEPYRETVTSRLGEMWNDSAFQYYFSNPNTPQLDLLEFASTYQGEPIGKFEVLIDIKTSTAYNISHVCFSRAHGYTFGKDLVDFFRRIMRTYRKTRFFVAVENPDLPSYERIWKRYGGRIVGIMEREVMFKDGRWHDIEIFEYVKPEAAE
jgi:hypothetical protein